MIGWVGGWLNGWVDGWIIQLLLTNWDYIAISNKLSPLDLPDSVPILQRLSLNEKVKSCVDGYWMKRYCI